MSFAFPEPSAEKFDLGQILWDKKLFPAEYVKAANIARQKMCEAMASQPSSQGILDLIEGYLAYASYFIDAFDSQSSRTAKEFPHGVEFRWKSVLSKGIRMSLSSNIIEKPMVGIASIWYEGACLVLAYGYTLANMANNKIGSNPGSASEASLAEACSLLCRASGAFKSVYGLFLARWMERDDSNKIPPECSLQMTKVLSELMLADANRLALAKGERREMSPNTLLRVGMAVCERYEQCTKQLETLSKPMREELGDPIFSYVRDGHRLAEALLFKRFGQLKHEEDDNGLAVVCLTHARNNLDKCARKAEWGPIRKTAATLLAGCDELRDKAVRLNNNVTYQPVPELSEARARLPPGCNISEMKSFTLPAPISPTTADPADN